MRLDRTFFQQDVLKVAPLLIGKKIVRNFGPTVNGYVITEVEAYRGTEDKASHARFGKTLRNAVMFENGGQLYVYLIYGIYWMINIVTGKENIPQAVLIRGLKGIDGPGKVTKHLMIDQSFNGENLEISDRLWIEEGLKNSSFIQKPRFGIDYASEPWKSMPWRYIMVPKP